MPKTRSDGLLCLSGSYSRLLQGQKLPTGLRVLSVRFARSRAISHIVSRDYSRYARKTRDGGRAREETSWKFGGSVRPFKCAKID
jgi:hypothetical protein